MNKLDATLIRNSLSAEASATLDDLELFGSIESTNTYLLAQPPPRPGRIRVAIADHQTVGRGRHSRRWVSPPGAGLYLSLAYTFAERRNQLSNLTLAIGVGILAALKKLGIAGVSLKWPNDVVALDGKLGGILTEVHAHNDEAITVVTGVGLNIELSAAAQTDIESEWAQPVDIRSVVDTMPEREIIAAAVIDALERAMRKFETLGFVGFATEWAEHDWLCGREVTVELPDRQITGIAAGVDVDGALLVNTGDEKTRVVSGSIVKAGLREHD